MKQKETSKTEYLDLWNAFKELKSEKEFSFFLRDICTLKEIEDMSLRLSLAKDIDKGIDYRTLAKKYNTSTTTVTRVSSWLHHGMGGYRLVLDRLKDIQH